MSDKKWVDLPDETGWWWWWAGCRAFPPEPKHFEHIKTLYRIRGYRYMKMNVPELPPPSKREEALELCDNLKKTMLELLEGEES